MLSCLLHVVFVALGDNAWKVQSEFIFENGPTPQCHASTLAETSKGLVAAWFGGKREGADDVGIWVARHDRKAWARPVEVATGVQDDGKRLPCWNPVLYQPKSGPLTLYYKVGPSPKNWWCMAMTSSDAGQSWSKPQRLPDGIIGPVRNKILSLPDGTLLSPSSTEHNGWKVHFEKSADAGRTWTALPPIHDGKTLGLIQPAILRHADGTLQALCRSRQLKIAQTFSKDGGKTWSAPELTALPNPNSGVDATTLADGRFLLVYNHTVLGRSPLNVALSKDGKDWQPALVLEKELGEFSYPCVLQTSDGLVHITYTWKRQKVKHVVIELSQAK